MVLKVAISIIYIAAALCVTAQQRILGTVLDNDGNAIPAVIYSTSFNATAQCDGNGKFLLAINQPLPIDTLTIRQLGFQDKKVIITDTDTAVGVVYLQHQIIILDGVPVSAREADNLIRQAFAHISENYPQQKTIYPALYRQVHRENGRYVRLIEASLDIAEPRYDNHRRLDGNTGIHIKDIRRSGIYEDNGDEHGDHLADLLADNPIQYFHGTILSPSAGKDVVFWIDTATLQRKDSVVIIGYSAHTFADSQIETGLIYINRPDMAITRIESNRERNKNMPLRATGVFHSWELIGGGRVVQFKKIGRTYYLDSMAMWYTHNVREREFSSKAWRVEETFCIWAGTPNISPDAVDIPFSIFGGLYTRHYKYNPTLWQASFLLKQHPLNDAVAKGLSSYLPLEKQFEKEE